MKNLIFGMMVALFALSCGEEDQEGLIFEDGVFVVNEGPFLSGTGTLSFIGEKADTIAQNVYSRSNAGAPLGNIAQSMIDHDGQYYIAINNADKIVIADDKTLAYRDTITIAKPRYFAAGSDKLYVSAWGDTGADGAVYEISSTGQLSAPVIEGSGPEGLLISGQSLYIAKGGGFGVDSSIVIVDMDDNSITKTLMAAPNPSAIAEDDNGDIYVLCSGVLDFYDPAQNVPGAIVKIVNQEIVESIEVATGSSRMAIDTDNGQLYYISTGSVYRMDLMTMQSSVVSTTAANPYSLAYDNTEDRLYVGDAKDFSSLGSIFVLDADGQMIKEYECGIIPTFFHFD